MRTADTGPLTRLFGLGLTLAVLAFLGGVLVSPRRQAPAPRPVAPPPAVPITLPTLEPAPIPPVEAGPRGVSRDVEATADVKAAPWAPGLRLHTTALPGDWHRRRAVIEDLSSEDRRSYAIGDLLPHGSLLVGISTGAAQVFVADREIVELRADGTLRSVDDFRGARPAPRLARVPDLSDAYVTDAQRALEALASEDPAEVQAAIDALIAAGEPILDIVVPATGRADPVLGQAFAFPSGYGPERRPAVHGDLVVGVLEAITGHSFGDVFAPQLSAQRRAEVARAWRRWWGLE